MYQWQQFMIRVRDLLLDSCMISTFSTQSFKTYQEGQDGVLGSQLSAKYLPNSELSAKFLAFS